MLTSGSATELAIWTRALDLVETFRLKALPSRLVAEGSPLTERRGLRSSVVNRWKTSGCYDEIVRRLGYRLVLLDSYRTENPTAGSKFDLALRIVNRGYAAPQNPRNAILVFVDGNGKKTEFELGSDPRTWHTGVHVIKTSFTLPAAKGTLYLNLSDPMLPDRPEYSIALANKNMFDSATGLNKILELK